MSSTQENNLKMRGEAMSRVETFVAAAFAFATTMAVISEGEIPTDFNELIDAVKRIPGFVASCIIIIWIWFNHAQWSRWFGLEDTKALVLSGGLICLTLIYVYPLKMMMQGLFYKISGGYFPFELPISEWWHLRFLFSFYAIGFFLLSLNFFFLFQHAYSLREQLQLSEYEVIELNAYRWNWLVVGGISIIVLLATLLLPNALMQFSPFAFLALFFTKFLMISAKYSAIKKLEQRQ